MRRFCQLQRLDSQLPPITSETKKGEGGLFEMDEDTYQALLNYYQLRDPAWRNYQDLPHPEGAKILGIYAKGLRSMTGGRGEIFTPQAPTNVVQFTVDGKVGWGIVIHLLKIPLEKGKFDSIVVLRLLEQQKNLLLDHIFKQIGVVHTARHSTHILVESSAVISTLSHRELPAWTFGCSGPSILLSVASKVLSTEPDNSKQDEIENSEEEDL